MRTFWAHYVSTRYLRIDAADLHGTNDLVYNYVLCSGGCLVNIDMSTQYLNNLFPVPQE